MKHIPRKSSRSDGKFHSNRKTGNRNPVNSTREEIRSLIDTVKKFNASALEGKEKRRHKDDILVKLGAAPPKQQKMPFKMRMGIMAAQKRIEGKQREENKASNVALPTAMSGSKKKRNN